ncbi:MAG: putative baseplate assembly protein, partial [Phormidium sp.]
MDFDFLPNLPKSNLDDRRFQDLVDECILRIPRYCPEWTNYNPSDPGLTLVELFAWLTDQMLARFNQVPRRNYITFLELLGIRLQPPTPAQTIVTFYLSTVFSDIYTIPAGIEVATIRTETEEAVVFSTERPLVIGKPSIRHFLTAERAEEHPSSLRDRFVGSWTLNPSDEWEGREISLFNEQPQPGNCFYVVFDGEQPLEGNAIAINFRGEAATSTGINPEHPPRHWEAWNGNIWESVLLKETDDRTQGFSFAQLTREGGDPISTGADILLHIPLFWPVTQFITYQGRWLRCVCTHTLTNQPSYIHSPRIVGMNTFAIGGSIEVSQCTLIRNEIVGESNGNPGQTFQLQAAPILLRREGEYLTVTPSGGLPQVWREVDNFASSTGEDLHYVIDSLTGTIQFGPLIREPAQLREQTYSRTVGAIHDSPLQGSRDALVSADVTGRQARAAMERQYGAVPPRGSTIQMVAYRTGGGNKGNVQAGTIQIVKSAVPYVTKVINYQAAQNGADAESLENAVLRVPRMLRTRNRAVTAEDFETLALEAGGGAIARV